MSKKLTRRWHFALVAAMTCVTMAAGASASWASEAALRVYAPTPDSVTADEELDLEIAIDNVGGQPTSGPIVVSDTLSPGLGAPVAGPKNGEASPYSGLGGPTTCDQEASTLTCTTVGSLPPGAQLFIHVQTQVESEAAGILSGAISVSGGGTVGTVHAEQRMTVGPPGPFAFTFGAAQLLNADGTEDTQAASNPSEFTTSLQWRSFSSIAGTEQVLVPVERFKDVIAHLPPGLIGNPSATPALCTPDQLAESNPAGVNVPNCPLDSQVGVAHIDLNGSSDFTPLFNMVAPYGVATELGFQLYQTNVLLDAYVRPSDHGIDIISRDTSTSAPVTGVDITVWGVPSDPSHDPERGPCLSTVYEGSNGETCPTTAPRTAFLRTPTSCSGAPIGFGAESNSYEKTDTWVDTSFFGPTMTGCDVVPFSPSITVDPTVTSTSSPTGVSVKLSLPQSKSPEGLAEADLKKAVVTLPEGMAINPSAADGLEACDDAHLHLGSNTPAECPDGSKIGTVLLHTQLIPNPIEGSIYLRPQASSDPMSGEMFRIVIELRDDSHGLDFKIPGQIQANPVTGRLTTTFDDNPQFPFEDISLQFKSGARAPLVTPASCIAQTTEASLYPWSRPDDPALRSSSFQLTSGPGGSPCPSSAPPFKPSFTAGVGNVEAGDFAPFLATFSRTDADQSMKRVSVELPAGLLGSLSNVVLCGEAQANAGTCGPQSEIGTVTAGAGAGPTPFYVTGGKVFTTGPYEGAPYGLSVVVPAKAGPFDLGTVVVRAKIEVDPYTARLTVTTDPLPQIVDGVPVNLRLVNVTINRHEFTFNPTDCNPLSVVGTMTGGQGAVATLSNHFQVTNCGALRFEPQFKVSVSGKTSRANGAGLEARLAYPKNAFGKQANIARVKVSLPKQLPSRLTTLQKACTAQVFDANPSACPSASRIGTAVAHTPVIPVPLYGPIYFVSHGGEAFPDLVIVLQGYGVTVDLVGTTFISKAGITSTTFKAVPDVPVGSFEMKLPRGPYSALAAPTAKGSLCGQSLVMPTEFTGQNGAQFKQNTRIEVEGCPNTLSVRSHRVKKRTLTLKIYVPGAGRLHVAGRGLRSQTSRPRRRKIVTVKVHERQAAGSLKTKASVVFKPSAGKSRQRQGASLSVQFRSPHHAKQH